jgi:DNA-binding LacI/PurR family transcriptional regulator
MRISLTQVARHAGVSIATASRAINQTGPMADETRQKVIDSATELGYVPDPRFRAMGQTRQNKPMRTNNMGLILPTTHESQFVSSPYYARMFWTLQQVTAEHDHHLTLSTIDPQKPQYIPSLITDRRVDGVIVTRYNEPDFLQRIRELMPVVLINEFTDVPGIPALLPDNHATILRAFEYLRGLGHKKICYYDIHDFPNRHHYERAEAFVKITRQYQAGLSQTQILKLRIHSLEQTCANQLLTWQQNGQMPTALLCASDHYALAFIEAAQMLKIRVPQDLSILGVDDLQECEYCRPQLTSIRQPLEAISRAAVNLLLEQIDELPEPQQISSQKFDIQLIERESCGPPRPD